MAGGSKEWPRPNLAEEEERLFLKDLTEEQEEMIQMLNAEKARQEREEREADWELQRLSAASKRTAPPSSSWAPPGGRPQLSHPHGGQDGTVVVDQMRDMAILTALNRLADRFDQPTRPAPPTVPRFTDSYRNWPRFRQDIEAYLSDFYARADERVRVLFLKEKCFSTAALAKIVHLETVDEILAVLGECYVRPDSYEDEVLGPVRKMRSLDEYDAIRLESFYATILAILCVWYTNLELYKPK